MQLFGRAQLQWCSALVYGSRAAGGHVGVFFCVGPCNRSIAAAAAMAVIAAVFVAYAVSRSPAVAAAEKAIWSGAKKAQTKGGKTKDKTVAKKGPGVV